MGVEPVAAYAPAADPPPDQPRPPPSAVAVAAVAAVAADGQDLDLPKLQALLYYCQAWHLALTGQPLFDEPIRAGPDGPYVESVAQLYTAAAEGHAADTVTECPPSAATEPEATGPPVLEVEGSSTAAPTSRP